LRLLQCELDVCALVLRLCVVRVSDRRDSRCCPCVASQIMFNLEKAHFILDEMVMNGYIVETNKISILKPIHLMEKSS
jgi:AP-4 complex subunit sigma-1